MIARHDNEFFAARVDTTSIDPPTSFNLRRGLLREAQHSVLMTVIFVLIVIVVDLRLSGPGIFLFWSRFAHVFTAVFHNLEFLPFLARILEELLSI
jgi:hypothetical protein